MTLLAKPVAVLGGMFDPVHFGHLRSAVELREDLDLDQVRLIPCARPPHRPASHATAEQRRAMLELAIAGEPGLMVDDREMTRSMPSYSVDTLASLRQEMPAIPLCLVVGMDAFLGLPTWHRWRELFDLAHVVVLERPGREERIGDALRGELEARRTARPEDLRRAVCGHMLLHRVTQLPISSTALRESLARGRSVRYLLPDVVNRYIQAHDLYRTAHNAPHVA